MNTHHVTHGQIATEIRPVWSNSHKFFFSKINAQWTKKSLFNSTYFSCSDNFSCSSVLSSRNQNSDVMSRYGRVWKHSADYIIYSTFLTVSSGSVLFSRSNLLKREDLWFSCLRLVLIRHRRNLRSSHLFSSDCHDFSCHSLENWYFS